MNERTQSESMPSWGAVTGEKGGEQGQEARRRGVGGGDELEEEKGRGRWRKRRTQRVGEERFMGHARGENGGTSWENNEGGDRNRR